MNEDGKIIIDEAQRRIIGDMICHEVKESYAKNSARYERAQRNEEQYNQITSYMKAGKDCDNPFKGAADYFIPMTEWIVDAVWSRILKILFSQEPFMTAKGFESDDTAKAAGVTDFVDMAYREIIFLYDNIKYFFKQMIKLPFAVIKYEWEQDFEPMIRKETANVFVNPQTSEEQFILPDDPELGAKMAEMIANGYQPTEDKKDVWVVVDEEITNAPKLRYIKFKDYVYSPNAKRGTRLYWEGDRFYMTINEMRLKARQERFISESVTKVIDSLESKSKTGSEKVIAERAELRECFNWYGRLPFNDQNEIDFENPDALEQEVFAVVDYKAKEVLALYYWQHKRLPYPDRVYIRGEFEESENFEGRSLTEKLYMTQKYMNTFYNTLMNNAWLSMQQIFVKKKFAQDDTLEPEVYPGAIWEEENQGDIRVLQLGDIKNIGQNLEQNLLNFAERVSNISILQTGTDRNTGKKSASEIITTIKEGNIGLDKIIQNCHNILRKISKWTVGYYADRMPPGLERRIKGENAGDVVFPTEENMRFYQQKGVHPYWRQEDLTGKFDFIWNGTSLSESKEYQIAVANDLMDRYLKVPMVGMNLLAVWEVCKRGLEARGIKDWQSILPPREQIIAEMKKDQAQAQADKQRQSRPNAEAMAVKKLEQQGMTQEQAIARVNEIIKQKDGASVR